MKALSKILVLSLAFLAGATAWAGSATGIYGLYYTGVANDGSTLDNADRDSHWTVTYARVGGSTYTGNSTYTGSAYVVSSNYIDGAWVQNSSSYRWITAPGARNTSSTGSSANQGGDYLPGNGTSGNNSAYFVYRLAFTITGNGGNGSNVTNNVAISLTIAADDQYSIYVNPASAPTVSSTGTISTGGTAASATRTAAWDNTTSVTLQNYGSGSANNADFVIGTNYLYIVVANTNSLTGSSSANALNPSGLLVYQVGTAMTIDGKPVPEAGTVLPVVAALGLFAWRRFRRRETPPAG